MGPNWYAPRELPSLASLIFAGSNGANLTFAILLGIPDGGDFCTPGSSIFKPENVAICDKNSWIVGFINSCPYIAIAVL